MIFLRLLFGKVGAFEFSRISRRDRVENKKKYNFYTRFIFCVCNVVSGAALPIFES